MLHVVLALAATAAAPVKVELPPEPALTESIVQADAEFFNLFFAGTCDIPRLKGMVADGAEFYHDRHGLVSADEFVEEYAKDCRSRADKGVRVRRELVKGSQKVTSIPGVGAFQTGEHLFFVRRPADTQERLAGRESFAQLWSLGQDGKWRLSRVFSTRQGDGK